MQMDKNSWNSKKKSKIDKDFGNNHSKDLNQD